MIHRKEIELGVPFQAPANVTFGYQEKRIKFSVWYLAGEKMDTWYAGVATGDKDSWLMSNNKKMTRIVSTVVMSDGFHAFHLVQLT